MMAVARQPDAGRARILEIARRQFAALGFEGASTRQIAAEAGVAQSLLLYHHRSKDALWRAVMDEIFGTIRQRLARAMEPVRDAPVEHRLMALAEGFVTLCAEEADIHRIMILEGGRESERLTWLAATHLRGIVREVVALIEEGQAAGVVRAGDPVALYYGCIALAGIGAGQAPLIRQVTRSGQPLAPAAIVGLIRAFLIVGSA
jgi:AcrR family transcriptional regulator